MKIVYNWLKEFVDAMAPAAELRSRLSLAGMSVDSLEDSGAGPVLDVEVTANRPDCLGHYGLAREVAAIYRMPVKPLAPNFKESGGKVTGAARVEIEAPELCGRFTARVMRGVKVQPSPQWLRLRLEAIGQNSINNVVDVSNYVMFELGQPMHAYDLYNLSGGKSAHAGRRRAHAGERHVRDRGRRARGGNCRRDGRRGQRNRIRQPEFAARSGVVRSGQRAARVQGAGPADRGIVPIRARRRSGNGGDGFAARGGADPAVGGGRNSRGRGGRVSGPGGRARHRAFAQGTAARDGRGRGGPRYRGDLDRAGVSARAHGRASRHARLVAGGLEMHAAILAARRFARHRFDRGSRAALRLRKGRS